MAEKVKPLDVSMLLRDAFLSGRGVKDGEQVSPVDMEAWMDYDPERVDSYWRIIGALYGVQKDSVQ